MSLNFRLAYAYNDGNQFSDLFPSTSMNAIQDNNNVLSYSSVTVTIPASTAQTLTQTISTNFTNAQAAAPFYVILNSNTEQSKKDFNTITQIEVSINQLTITRLYDYPQNDIEITLLFEEEGV